MMKVGVRYRNCSEWLEIDQESSIAELMALISEKFELGAQSQKLIFRGRSITQSGEALGSHGIVDGSKLLLTVQSEAVEVNQPMIRTTRAAMFSHAQPEFLTSSPHSSIIAKGPPPKSERPFHAQMSSFPKSPFPVYNTDGVLSDLTFESDAVWMQSTDGKQERIFYSDIRSNIIQEIPKYEKDYVALCLVTRFGKRWFYFIPGQYSQLLSKVMVAS
jgi:hypothetical protein